VNRSEFRTGGQAARGSAPVSALNQRGESPRQSVVCTL
jgi:hypothetical protein